MKTVAVAAGETVGVLFPIVDPIGNLPTFLGLTARHPPEARRQIIRTVVPTLTGDRPCACARALETAVLTPRNQIPAATRKRLSLFLGKKGA